MTTYDYADRPATLLARRFGQPDQPLVTTATYLPSGPLSSLTLGNGITETRSHTNRYFPSSIVAGSHLSWSYSTDALGNILSITFLIVALCFGSGCRSVTVDAASTVIFEANIRTEANKALGGVTISFVDTGIDAWRAKRRSELKVGVTDGQGRLSARWEYLWGYRKRRGQEAPAVPGTFLITLRHERYETIEKSFRLAELPRAGREYVVTLSVQMKERVDSGGKSEARF